jgi:hypothetical protein
MKTYQQNQTKPNSHISALWLNSCRNLLRQIDRVKQSIFRDFVGALAGDSSLLRGALSEAEALAWQTPFPHLVFPELAHEKAMAAAQWSERQQEILASQLPMAA